MRQLRCLALLPLVLLSGCDGTWIENPATAFAVDSVFASSTLTEDKDALLSLSPPSYIQSFDGGTGGWMTDNGEIPPIIDGAAVCTSPWTVDFWHAPPGGGYLNLLLWIHTHAAWVEQWYPDYPGNSYVDGGYPTNLTNARVTVRLRGDVDLQGARLHFWVQAEVPPGIRANYVLSGQPISFSTDWSEQSVVLTPDDSQWTCMYGRWDRLIDSGSGLIPYGCAEGGIAEVLADVNVDIILVLTPLYIVPLEPLVDPSLLHYLRAGVDYALDTSFLPSGTIEFDWLRIDYAQADT